MSVLTYRYRIKDATKGKHLRRLGLACNQVWNFCNEVSILAWRRERRFLTAFDLITLTKGSSTDLGLHSDTISEICRTYVARRILRKKIRLRWRSGKRSLGWIPFRTRFLKLDADSIQYQKRRYRFWASRPLLGIPKNGSFTQDARGRWYVNIQCEVEDATLPEGQDEIGIDLGLKNHLTCSDGVVYTRENLTQRYAEPLAHAQRARKKKRFRAIHAKIMNARKDWTHKVTTIIVNRARLIAVGNVSSPILGRTPMAKSVYDAGWGQLRACLEYKAKRLGVSYSEVNERYSSVTCSDCGARSGPSGLSTLGVRVWCCANCGSVHDRDHNAAYNILLRVGRDTL